MRFIALPISGAYRVEIDKSEDDRGFFARTFCAEEFSARSLIANFVQRSVSFNARRGTLRGLHYQADPHAETKIVRCTVGSAFDVIVDIRRSSPTFGRWHAEMISADNHAMMYVPAGCAHGFQTLANATELYYEITPAYIPAASRGIAFDDPGIGIAWPIAKPILSPADQRRPRLEQSDTFA